MSEPRITWLQYWPLGRALPEGWRAVPGQWVTHHHRYGLLIERCG